MKTIVISIFLISYISICFGNNEKITHSSEFNRYSSKTYSYNVIDNYSPNPTIPCPGSGNGFWSWLQDLGTTIGSAVGNFLGGVGDFFNSMGGGEGFGSENNTWVYDDSQIMAYDHAYSIDPNSLGFDYNTQDFYNNAAVYWDSYNTRDLNDPFADPYNPNTGEDEPLIDNGFEVVDATSNGSINSRIIAKTINRNNTEDMTSGYGSDGTGILPYLKNESDETLFGQMTELMELFTPSNSSLRTVSILMRDRFKSKVGGIFENSDLNSAISRSDNFINFIKKVGYDIDKAIKNSGGNINNVQTFILNYRPIFNGLFNTFHGLRILINDTEYTEILLKDFYTDAVGKYHCIIECSIVDHFGLDKNDALNYQNIDSGFGAWWVLQHQRGYVPFITSIHVSKELIWQP